MVLPCLHPSSMIKLDICYQERVYLKLVLKVWNITAWTIPFIFLLYTPYCRYAIGGYDGAQMVPTVEVFEPRVGSWTMLEPMKYARGYMGTVTLGNTIYVISGMQENEEILDTVSNQAFFFALLSFRFANYIISSKLNNFLFRFCFWWQVECYSEGKGWQLANLKSIGKRCFFSALAVWFWHRKSVNEN